MRICIEGNIGGGKSTICARLMEEIRIPIFLEPVAQWGELLDLFYTDPERWGFTFNTNVLMSYYKWKDNTFPAIYERSPLACRKVFAELQYKSGGISDAEMKLFDKLYKELKWTPDVIIYIKTSPEICEARMKKRGRECENNVSLDYLKSVHDQYEIMIKDNTTPEVFVINGDRSQDDVYQDVCQIVKDLLDTN